MCQVQRCAGAAATHSTAAEAAATGAGGGAWRGGAQQPASYGCSHKSVGLVSAGGVDVGGEIDGWVGCRHTELWVAASSLLAGVGVYAAGRATTKPALFASTWLPRVFLLCVAPFRYRKLFVLLSSYTYVNRLQAMAVE